ncbi:hypothetical protein N7493_008633 [Penicillium malachiteum]|uniref:Terpenoid synthase n=1 Tax=Penicillium malachiteum TaxID=1324776 RepID=A0AAD6HHH5_9EURO|nr:hypothetical protein N7493_008633 [Penicillium malachiteum]
MKLKMFEFQYSQAVDRKLLEDAGCSTTLEVRIHSDNDRANKISERFLKDWESVAGHRIHGRDFNCSPTGNFAALAYPECDPDRLEIVAQVCDLIWAEDVDIRLLPADAIEYAATLAEKDLVNHSNSYHLTAFQFRGPRLGANPGYSQLHARVLMQWEDADKHSFDFAMTRIEDQYEIMAVDATNVPSLEQYLRLREVHSGARLYAGLCMLSANIFPSNEEIESMKDFMDPLTTFILLTNDYYSYRKERNLHQALKSGGHAFNAVSVLMNELAISEDDAKQRIREMMHKAEEVHNEGFARFKQRGLLPQKLEKFIMLSRLFAGGFYYWTATSPRYFEDREIALPEAPPSPVDTKTHIGPFTDPSPQKLGSNIASAPLHYILSSPSKRVREAFIHALDAWYKVPLSKLEVMVDIVAVIHTSTLILDDVEDESPLRRQMASTHSIFGKAQAINSATYAVLRAFKMVEKYLKPESFSIVLDELEDLALGQSMDLNWRYCKRCPNIEEYKKMVDLKTGSLFKCAVRLVEAESSLAMKIPEVSQLATLLGRYFQIRDDLKNLESEDYAAQKGFCEDFDEAKFSFPLVHSLSEALSAKGSNYDMAPNTILGILHNPHPMGLTIQQKQYVLDYLKNKTDSLGYTTEFLRESEKEIRDLLHTIETKTGVHNYLIRLLLRGLAR